MKNKKLNIFRFVFFIFSFWFLVLKPVWAQTLSLSLYPPLLEVMIQPGKSITQVYKLSNQGEIDLALTSKIVPFEPGDEQGNIHLLTPEVSSGSHPGGVYLDWFSFQNADLALGQEFILKQGEEQEIVLKLKVPADAKEDDYYATLLFETIPGVFLGQSGAQAQAKIGANILLTVSKDGQPPKKAEIEEFKLLNWQIIDSFNQPQFLLRIKNTGKAYFKPMGTITTTGWFNQKHILDLLPENVLVNSVRAINCATPDSPERVGPCQLKSKILLGSYKAKVEFGLDDLNPDYSAKITFFALPLRLILGLIVALALIWLVKSKLDKRFL